MRRVPPVRITGPLVAYAPGFGVELLGQGYTPCSARTQVELMADASRWMATRQLEVSELTATAVEEFLRMRRARGHTHLLSPRGMSPLLTYLRGLGVVAVEPALVPVDAVEELLVDYVRYLIDERGLARSTAQRYVGLARLFLAQHATAGQLHLEDLAAQQVSEFVLGECARRKVGSAKCLVVRLRSLLRFLHVDGRTSGSLVAAVPVAPSWRLASLPRGIDPSQVARLLAGCDRRTTIGRRDFAILTVLVRLGLRCCEVAALELGDLDWRAGEIVVRGKGRHEERLPLPVDVGEAIVGWLRRGRPTCGCRQVFTRLLAPHRGLAAGSVSSVVTSASHRAHLPKVSAHQLRHTAATQMLRAGADLKEVSQTLRHHSLTSTAIYAKVDHTRLSLLAQPWPGA